MPTLQEKRDAHNRATDLLVEQQIRAQFPNAVIPPMGWKPTNRDRARANRLRIQVKNRRRTDERHALKAFDAWSPWGPASTDRFQAMTGRLADRGYVV